MTAAPPCRVCGGLEAVRTVTARETMYGTGRTYAYFECADCGCLQIAVLPADPAEGYPPGYYSFKPPAILGDPSLKAGLKRLRTLGSLPPRHPLGRVVAFFYRPPEYMGWLRRCAVRPHQRILDVGCGAGELLVRLAREGFSDLTGVDPFLPADRDYPNGVRLRRGALETVEGAYDLVMLHHSFEHMADPHQAMAAVARRVRPGGWALVRIPVADSHAWAHYRENWVQLDAPRHLHLHTRRSMARLAGAAGLSVAAVVCDSTAFQFWGSEQCRQGLALTGRGSLAHGRRHGQFSRARLRRWERAARRLNREGRGDQAAFYLRRPVTGTSAGGGAGEGAAPSGR